MSVYIHTCAALKGTLKVPFALKTRFLIVLISQGSRFNFSEFLTQG